MGYEQTITIRVTCEGKPCGLGTRFEEDSYSGRNFKGFKIAFLSNLKKQGWKIAQCKGVIDTSLITDDCEEYDFEYHTHKAWFCENCAASGKIEEWKKKIKAERKSWED